MDAAARRDAAHGADNVFDKTYKLAAGYATGGATVLDSVRIALR